MDSKASPAAFRTEQGQRMRYLIIMMLALSSVFFASEVNGQGKTVRAVIDNDGVQRIEVIGGEYYFTPDHIIVKLNVPVELKIKKAEGLVPHNIVIHEPEAGIDINEALGEEPKVIKFTPKKAGKYHFYCDKRLLFFKSHKDRGMEGVIEIAE